MIGLRALISVCVALCCFGCASRSVQPDLKSIYNRSAQYHSADRNPVIVIPGILGSKLKDEATGRVAWGAFTGTYVSPNTPEGARLAAIPLTQGVPLVDLRDDIVPDGALDRVRLAVFGVPVTVKAYAGILSTLGAGGYRDETLGLAAIDYGDDHFTCFQFDYDWRRSNVENAAHLHRFILEKQAYVAGELRKLGQDPGEVKFDIVAHSMGGLLARYYLMYGDAPLPADGSTPTLTWKGAQHVDRLIMVGTPNAGAAGALEQLVNGSQLAPVLPKYQPAILGTMPAIYELLPRVRHGAVVDADDPSTSLDIFDASLWERMRWGLVSESQSTVVATLLPEEPEPAARRRIARDHLAKCLDNARRFHQALDVAAELPPGLRMILFAGDAVQTVSVIGVDQNTGAIEPLGTSPGDGTVTRASALLDERTSQDWSPRVVTPLPWSQVNFFFTNHLGLTTDPAFTDNVLYLLLEQPAGAPRADAPDRATRASQLRRPSLCAALGTAHGAGAQVIAAVDAPSGAATDRDARRLSTSEHHDHCRKGAQ